MQIENALNMNGWELKACSSLQIPDFFDQEGFLPQSSVTIISTAFKSDLKTDSMD